MLLKKFCYAAKKSSEQQKHFVIEFMDTHG